MHVWLAQEGPIWILWPPRWIILSHWMMCLWTGPEWSSLFVLILFLLLSLPLDSSLTLSNTHSTSWLWWDDPTQTINFILPNNLTSLQDNSKKSNQREWCYAALKEYKYVINLLVMHHRAAYWCFHSSDSTHLTWRSLNNRCREFNREESICVTGSYLMRTFPLRNRLLSTCVMPKENIHKTLYIYNIAAWVGAHHTFQLPHSQDFSCLYNGPRHIHGAMSQSSCFSSFPAAISHAAFIYCSILPCLCLQLSLPCIFVPLFWAAKHRTLSGCVLVTLDWPETGYKVRRKHGMSLF